MIFENESELKERVEHFLGHRVRGRITVTDDTSNYMTISNGTVLRLEGCDYFVTGEANEGRFGISDQPKYWVKYAIDLADGSRKIMKLVFYENFTTTMGFFTFRLNRNPNKESDVLQVVSGDNRFMQGRTVFDSKKNNIRIIDFIRGKTLYNYVAMLDEEYEEYFSNTLPNVLSSVVGCIEALGFLHKNGLQHGDVRNDHILIDADNGDYKWIDFDYEVNYGDYDIWSVGNILNYVVAKGDHHVKFVRKQCQKNGSPLKKEDSLLFFKHRLANLKKLYPYIPEELNNILMRFSVDTMDFYEDIDSIVDDLRGVMSLMCGDKK